MEQRSAPTLILTVYRKLRAAVHIAEKDRRRPVWKQRLVVASLVSLDALLTLLIFSGASYLGQGAWGWGELLEVAVATIAPSVAVWVGLRAFLGLYPGYGLTAEVPRYGKVYELYTRMRPRISGLWQVRAGQRAHRHGL